MKSNLMAVDLKILFHLVILIMIFFDYLDKFVFLCDCKPLTERALTSELQAYSRMFCRRFEGSWFIAE